ncbi:hydrolase [Peptacetobacter hominis]|uniref:Nucleotidase n=1 Tax=Peptacetobacter hominis TaxID=2743610 RepID=A0A544QT15_9FIRM|nr:hydrolase [Peptacetobacter hominis]TQQ83178.1 hydrolase [Peptacetobacter hominis]
MKKFTICVDIDGTVTDPYGFIPYLNEIFNRNLTKEEYTTLDWEKLYGIREDDFYINFDKNYSYTYEKAKAVSGARDTLKEFSDVAEICFVTARQPYLYDLTKNWLDKNGFSGYDIYTLGNMKKSKKAVELGCDIFVEDDPDNVKDLAENGIKVIIMDTNYNRNVEGKNIKRAADWDEAKSIIDGFVKGGGITW